MFVFPMAGQSKRFQTAGYSKPKYALKAGAKTVFQHVISGFQRYFGKEKFIFVYLEGQVSPDFIMEHCEREGLSRANVQTVPLSKPTDGQATTVVEGLRSLPSLPQGPLTIFNVDTIYHDFEHPKFIEDTTCAGYLDVFLGEGSHWSFVEPLNDSSPEGIAARVVEKQRISDLCSTGLYMFQSADLLLSHFDKFASRPANSLQGGERYIAPLYQSLIDTGSVVRYRTVASDKIEFCGTPEEYDALLKSNGWSGEQPDQ